MNRVFQKLFRRLRRAVSRKRSVAIFIPRDTTDCGVHATIEICHDRANSTFGQTIVVDQYKANVTDFFKHESSFVTQLRKRVFLFAHPNSNETGFEVRPSPEHAHRTSILPDWWLDSGEYSLVFFFTCNGAKVLNHQRWEGLFQEWISFDDDIEMFLASYRGKQCWKSLINNLMKISLEETSGAKTLDRSKSAFLRELAELYDHYDAKAGDTLNLIFLQRGLQSLTGSFT